jgi:hypothetical protein
MLLGAGMLSFQPLLLTPQSLMIELQSFSPNTNALKYSSIRPGKIMLKVMRQPLVSRQSVVQYSSLTIYRMAALIAHPAIQATFIPTKNIMCSQHHKLVVAKVTTMAL